MPLVDGLPRFQERAAALDVVVATEAGDQVAAFGTELTAIDRELGIRLQIVVDGGVVTVTGPVPDEGAKGQVLAGAASLYGAENVIDEIVVDETTTLEAGIVDFQGTVDFGDNPPPADDLP